MSAAENTQTPATETRCLRCNRKLKNGGTYGPRCAAIVAATDGLSAKQVDKMEQLIADEAIVKTNRKGVYHVVNEAGEVIHIAHVNGHCTCEWSQRRMTADTKVCYHVAGARLKAKPLIRKAVPVVPAAAPVALPASDAIWAELEALGALDAVPAF